MKCKIAHEQIVLAAYEELAVEQMQELEQHLAGCPQCREEQDELLALKVLAEALPVVEPDPNLPGTLLAKVVMARDNLPLHRVFYRPNSAVPPDYLICQQAGFIVRFFVRIVRSAGAQIVGSCRVISGASALGKGPGQMRIAQSF